MGKDIRSKDEKCHYCGGKVSPRIDDTLEGLKKRLEVFNTETLPVIEYYGNKGLAVEIDGEQEVEKVFEDIIENIEI
jgi:adenylate kinase